MINGSRPKGAAGVALIIWLCIPLFPSCSQRERVDPAIALPVESKADSEGRLSAARREKDTAFKSGTNSPIPKEERGSFNGLTYYSFQPSLRFQARLVRYPRPERLRLGTSTGEMRDALRYGYFDFEVQGRTCRLQVYRTMEDIESGGRELFIPFRDATSGKETYGGGRYIDLQENTSGVYDLDFNLAYNPYCAYAKSYSCPLPPAENTLQASIEAGEKNYK
jgi:uncharacterized protein